MKALHGIAFTLVIIGALNLGIAGLGGLMGKDWNVLNAVLGNWSWLENLVYLFIGLSAIVLVSTHKRDCRHCDKSGMGMQSPPQGMQ